jgi:polysaccharide biosynthesis transport protein
MSDKDQHQEGISGKNQFQPSHQWEDAEKELDLHELFLKLYRRRMAIIGIFVLVMAVTWLNLSQAVPRYTAQTLMVLELRKSSFLNLEELYTGSWVNPSVIGTEIDIIRSASLMERVADELRLERRPEFNPALVQDVQISHIQSFKAWIKGLWSPDSGPLVEASSPDEESVSEAVSPEEQEKRLRKSIIARLRGGLGVERRQDSYTITISYTCPNPELASLVANTVAEMYILDQLEARFEAARRANEWLAERLEGLRQEVQASEQAVKNVRQQSDMIQARGGTILDQHLGEVNAQLIQARMKKSRAETRLAQAREIMDRPDGIDTLSEVLDSGSIQQLRSEKASLRRRQVELGQRYGPRHPQMIQMDAEMSDLQKKIKEETDRILKSLENEVQLARAEEQSLLRSLNQLRSEAGQAMEAELQLRELERQSQSSRVLYESYLQRFQETKEQEDLQRPSARIISPAETPSSPSYPRKNRTMTMGMAAGLMFGIMGAFLLETLDRGFRTRDQLEKASGLPVLGMVPLLSRVKGDPHEYVLKKPFSSLSESVRSIRTAVHLSNVDNPPKSIMITSALPKEGKTSFSLALGRLAAESGTKTLVIDADLRRPMLVKHFPDLTVQAKLEDVLQGKAQIKEAIVKDPESNLHLLLSHGNAPAVGEMLGSRRMQDMLKKLREHYELIILDTPPILGVSDAWGLARNVDSVVFLVMWAETPRDTVRAALRQIEMLDIQVGGLVLSMVNLRQQSRYGYGGHGYYYGKYRKYYKE